MRTGSLQGVERMSGLNIRVFRLHSAMVSVNCCLVHGGASGEAMAIDPGGGLDDLLSALSASGLRLKYIVLTHGHFDHTMCTAALKRATGAEVCMHRGDIELKDDPERNATRFVGIGNIERFEVDRVLADGDTLSLGSSRLLVLHTPGHTPGEISLYTPGSLFCGDAVQRGTTGRLDLPGADAALAFRTVREKILTLPADTVLYCGHGETSTVAYERENSEVVRNPGVG